MENSKEQIVESKYDRSKSRDIKVQAYYFALKIIGYLDNLLPKQSNRVLADQLLRSTTSIGANIIEAQAASSKRDFINFLNHSLKSANETKFWLSLLRDSDKMEKAVVNELLYEVNEFSKILGSSILTAKGKRYI